MRRNRLNKRVRLSVLCVGGVSYGTKLARMSRRLDHQTVEKGLNIGLKKIVKKNEKKKKVKAVIKTKKKEKQWKKGKCENVKENFWTIVEREEKGGNRVKRW